MKGAASAVAVSVPDVAPPGFTVPDPVAPKLSEKSDTVSANVAECVTAPTVPVTVIVYVPGAVLAVVVKFNAEVAGVPTAGETDAGFITHVVLAGHPVTV